MIDRFDKIRVRFLLLWIITVCVSLIALGFVSQKVFAATGIRQTINFQGKVVNTDGTNVANGNYDFVFAIYSVATVGTPIWTETWNSGTSQVQVVDGVFRVELGTHQSLPGSVDFNTDNIWLGVNFNGDGEMDPRIRFTAVPYAFNAKRVAGLTVTDTTGTLTIPNATIAFSGANNVTLTSSAVTTLTLPTTGTLATLAGTEEFTNKTIGSSGLVFSGATNDITTVSDQHLSIMPNGTGKVGIGTSAPEELLTLIGNIQLGITDGTRYIYFDNGTGTNSGIRYDAATDKMQFSHGGGTWTDMGSGSAYTFSNGLTDTGGAVKLGGTLTANTDVPLAGFNFSLSGAGNVGIGTTTMTEKLTVAGNATISGTLALGPMAPVEAGTCDATTKGKQYMNGVDNKMYFCNGTAWTEMGSSGPGGALNFDEVYAESVADGNLTMEISNASGLTFNTTSTGNFAVNLSSTGDFVVNDGVSDLLKLNDDGTIDIVSAATTADVIDVTLASLTEGAGMDFNLDALTSGDGLRITSASTALTTGSLIDLLWNPSGSTERFSTGDIFKIDLGQYANALNIFALYDNAVKLFAVSQTKITSALPHEFTAAGDVSIAYDLVFTNQTSSLIDSYGPLTISSGEIFENQNLTLRAYGTGAIVLTASGLSLESGENLVFDSNDSGDTYIEHNNASNYLSFFVDGVEEVRFLNTSSIHTNNDITTGFDFDIAESYPTFDESLRPGDIVSIRPDNDTGIPAVVEKSDETNAAAIIGIVSTSPAISMGTGSFAGEFCSEVISLGVDAVVEQERQRLIDKDEKIAIASASATATESASIAEQDKLIKSTIEEVLISKRAKAQTCLAAKQVLVTLAGRIPLRVSLENGPIQPGDALALSSETGIAAKAIKAGTVVGKALEPYTQETETGKIMAFANLTYYPGYALAGSSVLGTSVNLSNADLPSGLFQQMADALVIPGDVSVTRTLFASDIYAADSLSTGVIQIDGANSSISTADGDLRLQVGDAIGNVDIFNGLLVFTPDGGIVTQADIMANRVKANELVILGAADNQQNAAIGSGNIPIGKTTTVVTNTLVKSNSKIFLTATSGTGGQSLIVENKNDGSFTVSLDRAHSNVVTFDYWIVGVE